MPCFCCCACSCPTDSISPKNCHPERSRSRTLRTAQSKDLQLPLPLRGRQNSCRHPERSEGSQHLPLFCICSAVAVIFTVYLSAHAFTHSVPPQNCHPERSRSRTLRTAQSKDLQLLSPCDASKFPAVILSAAKDPRIGRCSAFAVRLQLFLQSICLLMPLPTPSHPKIVILSEAVRALCERHGRRTCSCFPLVTPANFLSSY